MTRVADTVRVPLTAEGALAASRWLATYPFVDKPSPAVEEHVLELIRILTLAGRHKRTHITLKRTLARYASTLADDYVLWSNISSECGAPPAMMGDHFHGVQFGNRCTEELSRRRGRPKRTPEQTEKRIDRLMARAETPGKVDNPDDARELRRLRQRARMDEWLEWVHENGVGSRKATKTPPK